MPRCTVPWRGCYSDAQTFGQYLLNNEAARECPDARCPGKGIFGTTVRTTQYRAELQPCRRDRKKCMTVNPRGLVTVWLVALDYKMKCQQNNYLVDYSTCVHKRNKWRSNIGGQNRFTRKLRLSSTAFSRFARAKLKARMDFGPREL